MDARAEASDFLRSRRARLSPEAAGLGPSLGARRVAGLRREEVATLAGVSAEYYNRMERGRLDGVSDSVLAAVAQALQLDDSEESHLFDLARSISDSARPRGGRVTRPRNRSTTQRLLDGMTGLPAYARNARTDIVAINRLGAALLPGLRSDGREAPNLARYVFLDPEAQDFYVEWERVARDMVGALRVEAGKTPFDRGLTDLIGELSTRSDAFRTWWAAHNVRHHTSATKTFRHPVVGEIEVTGEAMRLPGDGDLVIIAYLVEPASPSDERLQLLASWAASQVDASSAPS